MIPHTKRILCVEDDPDACELLRISLGGEGYQVVTAASSAEALVKVTTEHFDLYLFDVYLSDADGFGLCQQVHALDPNAPVFLYSADARVTTRQRALEAGATYFLTKPLDPFELLRLIQACLRSVELHVLEAKVAELQAIHDEIAERHERIRVTLTQAKEMADKIKEHTLKVKAFQAFSAAGGTRAAFERLWPDVCQSEILSHE